MGARIYGIFGRGDELSLAAANAAGQDGALVFQRIAPYCDAPLTQADGTTLIQRFTPDAARRMVEAFGKGVRRLLEWLPGVGTAALPCYHGHPDHAEAAPEDAADTRVYARVERLEARDDGLWALLRKTPELERLKAALGGRLEISPRWLCEPAGDGVFTPVRLISLGFVRRGNLPNADAVNELNNIHPKKNTMNEEMIGKLAEVLGVEPDAAVKDPALLIAAAAEIKAQAKPAPEDGANEEDDDGGEAGVPVRADPEGGKPAPAAQAQPEDPAKKDAANAKAMCRFVAEQAIANAFNEGRITAAQIPAFRALLQADFANAMSALASLPKALNAGAGLAERAAKTAGQARRKAASSANEAGARLLAMANERQRKAAAEGAPIGIADALLDVRSTKEGAELYAAAMNF